VVAIRPRVPAVPPAEPDGDEPAPVPFTLPRPAGIDLETVPVPEPKVMHERVPEPAETGR
jgi:hypothetical protein